MMSSLGATIITDPLQNRLITGTTKIAKPGISKIRAPTQSKLQQNSKPKPVRKAQIKPPGSVNENGCNSPKPTRKSGIKAPVSVNKATTDVKAGPRKTRKSASIETVRPTTKIKRAGKSLGSTPASSDGSGPIPSPRSKSGPTPPQKSGCGPAPPPRSGAGIKRSVTARQSTSKSLAATAAPTKTKICKHPSLEMERSVSSESNSNDSSNSQNTPTGRQPTRTKIRQPVAGAKTGNPPKRQIKRPSIKKRPTDIGLSRGKTPVQYSEPKSIIHNSKRKSQSIDNLEVRPSLEQSSPRLRGSSLPNVTSPSELLWNESLHAKLSQNESNRQGFILTDTDASIVSCASSEFLSMSPDPILDHEAVLTLDDLKLTVRNDYRDLTISTISSSDLMSTDDTDREDVDDDDYDDVPGSSADETSRNVTPVSRGIASLITQSSALNDLSDPNRSPASNLNITLDEYGVAEEVTIPDNSRTIGIPALKQISQEDWDQASKGNVHASPEENVRDAKSSDQELYYDSSDLNVNALTEDEEDTDKEINTAVNQNMSTSLKDKAVMKEIDMDIKLSETGEVVAVTTPEPLFSEEMLDDANDKLTPLKRDGDPLALFNLNNCPEQQTTPVITEESDSKKSHSAPASITRPKFPTEDISYFSRNQRSIRPSKRRSMLVRSSSLDKKHLIQENRLTSESADSFSDIYIVQTLTPCSPISISDREFLNTPEILINNDTLSESLDSPTPPPDGKHGIIFRNTKNRSDVVRRFSETQVFKHHKERFQKQKENEGKYQSCPVPGSPNSKVESSTRYIKAKGFVKRVSSLLTPTNRPRVLLRKGRDSFGSTWSINFDSSSEARSLHDPDTPDNSGNDRLNRSSSLEMVVDNLSSIKRTHSEKEKHETESSEHSTLTSKAKSITEQLERITYNLNISEGIPTLEYKNWTELLPESVIQSLGKKEEDQQHHIWELVTTEHNYITTLSTIINTLLGCLRELHNENYLTKINENDVFLNIEDIRRIHLIFWNECVVPLIQTTKDTGEPLNPEIFTGASTLFEEELNPLFEYCINYHESRNYIKSQQHKNNDFKEYINWCNNQIRLHHNKLGIDDMLIKPIQRIQKYPIIIRDILKKTTDDDTKCVLSSFHEKVRVFVESLNRRKEEKEESQKIEGIKDRIESYSVLPSSSSQTNDQINQILSRYTKFDLSEKVPLLNTQRKFLHENTCKMSPTIDAKAQDITLFLFSDHILITRPNKKKPDQTKKKTRIIKQPLTLDRVVIEEMKDLSHTSLIVYLNEYGSLVDMFLLQSSNQESHTTLLNAVIQAKDHYIREKNKLYTELDAGKSVSSTSVNSAGNFLTTSPAIFRHPPCSITRSSSEHYPPARRTTTDPASSVARAQSMPASNERRNLVPPSIASSSSSSASSSSSSVSEAPSSDKMGILSDIKESDKSTESGTDEVPANEQTNIIPALVKTIDADVYISDNLSTEFSNNMDLNKGICDSVNKDNTSQLESDKLLFSKTDALYIDHHQQSES